MKTKKLIALLLTFAMLFALCACGSKKAEPAPAATTPAPAASTPAPAASTPAPAAPKTEADLLAECKPIQITVGQNDSGDIPAVKCTEEMLEAITQRSDGKITFNYQNGGALGSYVEMIESMALGGLDMGILDPTLMTEYAPEYQMLIQPFTIKDFAHFGKALDLPEVKGAEEALAANNITVLDYYYCGFRAMCFTKKEVKTLADCKGIIIRSPEADIYMNTLTRLGMKPTPMAMGDMYTAMKQGVIEGAEPAAVGMDIYSLYEVCPYMLRSNHMFSFNSIVLGTKFWNSLPEVYRTIISEEAAKAAAKEKVDMEASEDGYFDKFKSYGCTINNWANYQELVDLFAPTWDEAAAKIGGNAAALLKGMKDAAN